MESISNRRYREYKEIGMGEWYSDSSVGTTPWIFLLITMYSRAQRAIKRSPQHFHHTAIPGIIPNGKTCIFFSNLYQTTPNWMLKQDVCETSWPCQAKVSLLVQGHKVVNVDLIWKCLTQETCILDNTCTLYRSKVRWQNWSFHTDLLTDR